MNKLTARESLRHLELLAAAAPELSGVFAKPVNASAFLTLIERLQALIKESGTSALSLKTLRSSLFPHATGDSQRVLFSNFRRTLAAAATASGRNFSLHQPGVRGKSPEEVFCHFEGDPISTTPEIDAATRSSVAGLSRQPLVDARAAIMTRDAYIRITEILWPQTPEGRRPIRIFLSYAHKDDHLVGKLLDRLRDELAISKRFAFSLWMDTRILSGNEWHQDIQQALQTCDLCLALVSPGFLASGYIIREELPLIVDGVIPAVPVMLEPVDFSRHQLRGLESRQIVAFKENQRGRAYSECTGQVAKRFVQNLAEKIEEKVPSALEHLTRQILGDSERLARALSEHPEIGELLSAPPAKPDPENLVRPSPLKTRLAALLKNIPQDPDCLLKALGAVGGLRTLTRAIEKPSRDESDDPYERFSAHARSAVDALHNWVVDPSGPPFAAVLGEIGSGKTTMLRMLTSALVADPAAPPVIFIDLRDYFHSGDPTLEGLLAEHLRRYDANQSLTPADLLQAIRKEQAVIIFDGLDEKIISMSEEARKNFIRELWRVLPPGLLDQPAGSGRGRLVISCRSHYFPTVQSQSSGYLAHDRGDATEKDYLACIMLPWQDEQIRDYLRRFLGEEKSAVALDLIDTIHNLRDLAKRPYLLSLIGPELEALEADRVAGHSINAAALYHKFTERWMARDEGKHLFTPTHKRRLMEQLAADLWHDNAREWPWEQVEEWLDGFLLVHPALADAYREISRAVLKQDFRTATLFLRPDGAADAFRFAHTSLQEYFLAGHLARSLYVRGGRPAEAWELPMPSLETLDFLGQILAILPSKDCETALRRLGELLGDSHACGAARTIALRYFLLAHKKELPVPKHPNLALAGINLTAWEFHGTAQRPLQLGTVDFSATELIRASFEYLQCDPGSRWHGVDLRSAKFIECQLPSADFNLARLDGVFFRKCDLRGGAVTSAAASRAMLHLCRIDPSSPWPTLPSPTRPSLCFQNGHSGSVTSVAFSPDGKFVVSGADDKTLKLWEVESGKCLRSFVGHEDWVTSVAFSPDGKFVVSGAGDKTLKLWAVESGKCLRSFVGHEDWVTSVAFSPDGKFVVSGADDKTLKLWAVESGKCLRSFVGHEGGVTSVAFSPDGKFVLSGAWDKTLKLWAVESGKCLRSFVGHEDWVTSVAFSPDGKFVVSGVGDKTLKLWEVESGKCLRSLIGHENWITSVAFSPDGKFVLSGASDKTLTLWEVEGGKCLRSFVGHEGGITSVAFSPDGKFVLSGASDKTLKLWEVEGGKCLRSFVGHEDWVTSVAFSPDGKFVVSGASDKTLKLWEVESGKCLRSFVGHEDWVTSVAFSPDGKFVVSSAWDKTLKLWEVESGKCLRSFVGHENGVTSVAFSPDGKFVVSGEWDKTLKLWEVESGKCLRSFVGHEKRVTSVAFSPDGLQILSRDVSGKTRSWSTSGDPLPVSLNVDPWLAEETAQASGVCARIIGGATIRLQRGSTLLREILVLPDGQSAVREPWNEIEASKPDYACRWKLAHGPADVWRYASAIDMETNAIHPPEAAEG